MKAVRVSARFQTTIPLKVRESLRICPGQKLQVAVHDGIARLIPIRPMKEMRGFLKGIDTTVDRGMDRE
ncbi:MAG TPA: AbrB/MazE/SpoVT family DNA-binding domain-containing protein [Terriglobia bacterium]|nr:AbrB/MazE/SpoVT family DNA-binding domain-containing protein [Terriglobia bacterium]